jgi:dihydrofolate reductase
LRNFRGRPDRPQSPVSSQIRGGIRATSPPTRPERLFSSTLEEPLSWANTELVDRNPVETVQDMKRRDSRPLRTVGSLSLCRSLLEAGEVDRFRVVVFPVITGATGKDRIFDGYPDFALDLVDTRTFDGRLQLLEYVPTVLDGPPGVSY